MAVIAYRYTGGRPDEGRPAGFSVDRGNPLTDRLHDLCSDGLNTDGLYISQRSWSTLAAFQAAVTEFTRQHPNPMLPEWCTADGRVVGPDGPALIQPSEVKYAVRVFVPVAHNPARPGVISNEDTTLVLGDGEPAIFECAHCAMVAGHAELLRRGATEAVDRYGDRHRPQVYLIAHTARSNMSRWLPPVPELAGQPMGTETIKDVEDEGRRSCGNCGMLGHNSRTCERPTKAHDRIGIEIEGRFADLSAARLRADSLGATGCGDGSIGGGRGSPYEFQTKPAPMAGAIDQLVSLYPDDTDGTCGMHVHVSFNAATDVGLLCTEAFFGYFRRRWEAWGTRMGVQGRGADANANSQHRGEFWRRLYGGNDYCNINTHVPNRIQDMDRYHQLNFAAYEEHGTVECRLLPMFRTSSLAVSAVQELISIYEDFLADPIGCGLVMPSHELTSPPVDIRYEPIIIGMEIDEVPEFTTRAVLEIEADTDPAPKPAGMIRTYAGPVEAGLTLRQLLNTAA